MSYMNHAEFAPAAGIQELSFDEIDLVAGTSAWGDNVVKYGGIGLALGGLGGGVKGAAIGGVLGAIYGTYVTINAN